MSSPEKESPIEKVISKILEMVKTPDLGDLLVYTGLAYLGNESLPEALPQSIRLLWGPIALKLATSPSGGEMGGSIFGTGISIPMNSQIAGLTMLAFLGFESLPWVQDFQKNRQAMLDAGKISGDANQEANSTNTSVWTQEEKDQLLVLQRELGVLQLETLYGGVPYREGLMNELVAKSNEISVYIAKVNASHGIEGAAAP